MKIGEIDVHSSFENGKRALALAHALRASHSGGSPWVEQTRRVIHVYHVFETSTSTSSKLTRKNILIESIAASKQYS